MSLKPHHLSHKIQNDSQIILLIQDLKQKFHHKKILDDSKIFSTLNQSVTKGSFINGLNDKYITLSQTMAENKDEIS